MEVIIAPKPTIMIYHHPNVSVETIQDLLFGIEEEGIPYSLEARAQAMIYCLWLMKPLMHRPYP